MNLSERQVEEKNYHQEHFLKTLTKYRHKNRQKVTVADFYDEFDITALNMGNVGRIRTLHNFYNINILLKVKFTNAA